MSRPDFDPELHTLLASMPLRTDLNPEALAELRQYPVGAGRDLLR